MDKVARFFLLEQEENARTQLDLCIKQTDTFSGKSLISVTHEAAKKNYVSIIELLHARWPACIDLLDREYQTPLHRAVYNGSIATVAALIRMNTKSAMIEDYHGRVPLEHVVHCRRPTEMLDVLYPLYISKDVPLGFFIRVIVKSFIYDCHELISFLHQKRPGLFKKRTQSGSTLLLLASDMCIHTETPELLCEFNPELIDCQDDHNRTAMYNSTRRYGLNGWNSLVTMHRYGSEAHFVKGDDGRTPVDISDALPRKHLQFTVRSCYFSRSLAEVLFFTLRVDEIQSLKRTKK